MEASSGGRGGPQRSEVLYQTRDPGARSPSVVLVSSEFLFAAYICFMVIWNGSPIRASQFPLIGIFTLVAAGIIVLLGLVGLIERRHPHSPPAITKTAIWDSTLSSTLRGKDLIEFRFASYARMRLGRLEDRTIVVLAPSHGALGRGPSWFYDPSKAAWGLLIELAKAAKLEIEDVGAAGAASPSVPAGS